MTSTDPWQRAIVIGASSGIGEAMVRSLAARGTCVAAVARRAERLTSIAGAVQQETGGALVSTYTHDVGDVDAVPALFQEITTTLGGLDLVIYAAGFMPVIAGDAFPTADDRITIDTNFTGAVAWLNEAALRFSRAEEGTIVGISSVAGDRGRTGNPVYGATKAALDTYLESLRARLARSGVNVVTIKPGFVRTAMLAASGNPRLPPPVSAERAAEEILAGAAAGKRVVYVPGWWRWIMMAVKAIPAPLFERLNI